MSDLVASADAARWELQFGHSGFSSILNPVDVDPSPARGIDKVVVWLEAEIPGLKRRLALAQQNEAQGPAFQGVVRIDESKLSTMDPSAARNLGAEAANKLRNGDIDPNLIAEIKKNQDDPYFAAGLAQNLTPAQLSTIVSDASNKFRLSRGDNDSSEFKAYQGLVSAVGTTIATATRNTDDLALPTDTGKTWVSLITQQPSGDPSYHVNQAAALSTLLKYGSFSTSFLHTVADGVYNYERSQGGKPVWRPRSGISNAVTDPHGVPGTSSDAMANVLDALGHNPDAAQQFFDVGNPNASTTKVKINGHEVDVNSRLKYLITDRTWSTNDMSDDGHGLGTALDAATTFYRNNQETGNVSATVASQTMALTANKIGDGAHGGHIYELGMGASDGWQVPNGMRTSLANIVSSYAPDLMRVGPNGRDSDPIGAGKWTTPSGQFFPPNGPVGASTDKDLMTKLLGTLGEDPKNVEIITTGVGAAGNLRMQYAMQTELAKDPNAPVEMLTGQTLPDIVGASNEIAATMGYLINSAYKGDASNQEFQKKQAEALSKAMGIVLAAPTFAVPGGAWTGYLLDQVKDAALEKVGEGPDQDAQSTYNVKASTSSLNLQQVMLNNMLAGGYLDKQYFDQAGPKYTPPPPGALKSDSSGNPIDPPQFNFQSPAYRDWSRGGQNLQSYLNTNVLTPFHNEFPALGAS